MKFIFLILAVLSFSFAAFGQTDREKGIALYQSNDYNAAVTVLQEAVKADANDRDAWFYLGMSLARNKKVKEAVKALRKADSIAAPASPLYDKEVEIKRRPRYRRALIKRFIPSSFYGEATIVFMESILLLQVW